MRMAPVSSSAQQPQTVASFAGAEASSEVSPASADSTDTLSAEIGVTEAPSMTPRVTASGGQPDTLLGMPWARKWVLYGPALDRSLLRNALAFDLARAAGKHELGPRRMFY